MGASVGRAFLPSAPVSSTLHTRHGQATSSNEVHQTKRSEQEAALLQATWRAEADEWNAALAHHPVHRWHIAVASVASWDSEPSAGVLSALNNHAEYCARHNYSHQVLRHRSQLDQFGGTIWQRSTAEQRRRPPAWLKLPFVDALLNRYDAVLSLDMDALITEMGRPVHALIQDAKPVAPLHWKGAVRASASLIISSDTNLINSGVMIYARSPWTQKFIEAIWAFPAGVLPPRWENGAP